MPSGFSIVPDVTTTAAPATAAPTTLLGAESSGADFALLGAAADGADASGGGSAAGTGIFGNVLGFSNSKLERSFSN